MSARSELLKTMAAAHALGDRAIPCRRDDRLNPATANLDEPAQALATLAPHDSMSAGIREAYTLLAQLLAAPYALREPIE